MAIELKTRKFQPQYKAQMEMYLRLLNEQERRDVESEPIGIILCSSADRQLVEFLEMDKAGIAVAAFWSKLPSKLEFEHKLREIEAEARERLERRWFKALGEIKKNVQYFIEPKDDNPDED